PAALSMSGESMPDLLPRDSRPWDAAACRQHQSAEAPTGHSAKTIGEPNWAICAGAETLTVQESGAPIRRSARHLALASLLATLCGRLCLPPAGRCPPARMAADSGYHVG